MKLPPFIKNILSGLSMTILSFESIRKHKQLLLVSLMIPTIAIIASLIIFFAPFGNLSFVSNLQSTSMGKFFINVISILFGRITFNFVYATMIMYFIGNGRSRSWKKSAKKCHSKKWKILTAWSIIEVFVITFVSTLPVYISNNIVETVLTNGWWLVSFLILPIIIGSNATIQHSFVVMYRMLISNFGRILGAVTTLLLAKEGIAHIAYFITFRTSRWLHTLNLMQVQPNMMTLSLLFMFSGIVITAIGSIFTTVAEASLATGLYSHYIRKPRRDMKQTSWRQLLFITLLFTIVFIFIAISLSSTFILVGSRLSIFNPSALPMNV